MRLLEEKVALITGASRGIGKAIALEYDADYEAPKILATGKGALAERIIEKAKEQSEKEIERAKREAERIVENARRAGNSLLLEIEQLKKEQAKEKNLQEIARKAKQAMGRQLDKMDEITNGLQDDDGEYTLPRPLKTGDRVFVKSLGGEAEVISIDENKNTVQVQSGMLKMKANISDLRLIGNKKQPKKQQYGTRKVHTGANATLSASSSVDLRGTTVEEAMLDLDKFIDGVIRTGLNEITIIHGKGTGVLRDELQKLIRTMPGVASAKDEHIQFGGSGVTVVTFE